MFENGLLNLTDWAGNVIMPTLAGLFFAAAIYRFSKAHPYSHLSWAGFAALMCSGLLRALETFALQAGPNDPDRYWISILTLVNWVGNVMLPLYGKPRGYLRDLLYWYTKPRAYCAAASDRQIRTSYVVEKH